MLGLILITYALMLANQREFQLFDAYLMINSVIALPLGLPILAALYIKRLPYWSYFFIIAACLLPSIWSFIDFRINGNEWTIQKRSLWIFVAFAVSVIVSMPFYRWSSPRYRKMANAFFERLHTPVDYAAEVGASKDYSQLKVMGNTCLVSAALLCLMFVTVREVWEFFCVVFVSGFIFAVGILLRRGAKIEQLRQSSAASSSSPGP
jgi:hypothetical protein